MHQIPQTFGGRREIVAVDAVDAERLVRPVPLAGPEIDRRASDRGDALRQRQMQLALAKLPLTPPLLGDVGENA
jgi:hypothetical protein